ncbi:MAG: acetate/propionate family kinase [Coriobacteriales bacterium]
MKILVFNAGSSSLKYKLFDAEMVMKAIDRPVLPEGKSLCKGMVENIGTDNAHFINVNEAGKTFRTVEAKTYDQAMDLVMKALTELSGAPLEELSEVDAIGHRVAHGGDAFNCSVVIDRHVIDVIKQYSELAPLHNPYALRVIERCKQLMPRAMQVAAFDTAFHQTMPRRTYIYPIPYRYYEKYNIRKFGFHGISHKYVSRRAAEFLGEDLRSLKMITCHLGAGASICAIDHGYSMDTSMGYTPLDGIMMNTRSGSVDPAIITAIMEKEHLTPHEMDQILNRESGFLGISGTSGDLRDLKEVIRHGDQQAELAYDIFLFSIRRMIGAYAFELAGVDAIVVTAGVGENDAYARRLIFRGLEPFGIEIDENRNYAKDNVERLISTDRAAVKMLVIPTDEEAEIARDVELIANGVDLSDPWAY